MRVTPTQQSEVLSESAIFKTLLRFRSTTARFIIVDDFTVSDGCFMNFLAPYVDTSYVMDDG